MIDADGYRSNVGIIICNSKLQVLWARRIKQQTWQFPQGGINEEETAESAMYRELHEEVGLVAEQVEVLAETQRWLRYKIPKRMQRDTKPACIGQKQKWFLVRFLGEESAIDLAKTQKPEFDAWMWVSYWYPVRHIIAFKREVYRQALKELAANFYKTSRQRMYLNNILDS